MRLALLRQIVALVTVVLFTVGSALSAAASTPHAHQDGDRAIHHGHAGHQPHADDSHDHDHANLPDHAPDGGSGPCDHLQHGCYHTHASCCVTALVAVDIRAPEPPGAAAKMAWSFDDLASGRMTHPLLRPPRAAV